MGHKDLILNTDYLVQGEGTNLKAGRGVGLRLLVFFLLVSFLSLCFSSVFRMQLLGDETKAFKDWRCFTLVILGSLGLSSGVAL